jgi:hypothetical protein
MSEHAHAAGGHPPAEPDRIRSGTIIGIGAGSLLIFAIASAVTLAFLHQRRTELNPDWNAFPSQGGQPKVGIVEQQLFENANRAQVQLARKRQALQSYGWIDRQKGVIQMPIDRAIELTLQGERP